MSQPARHLRVIDTDTGEIVPNADVQQLQDRIDKLEADRKALEKDLRAKRRQITELMRDKARERLDYPRYKDVERIATYWHKRCKARDPRVHPMSPDRFDAVRELLDQERIGTDDAGKRRREPHYSMEDFKRAIDGAWFDCFETKRRNGTTVRYDDLALICRSAEKFEEFIRKAPAPAAAPVVTAVPERFVTECA